MSLKGLIGNFMFYCLRLPNCQELENQSYDYTQGSLSEQNQAKIKRHLKMCQKCVQFLENYLKIKSLGKSIDQKACPDPLKDKIIQSILKNSDTK